jgi:hypothetical protein
MQCKTGSNTYENDPTHFAHPLSGDGYDLIIESSNDINIH